MRRLLTATVVLVATLVICAACAPGPDDADRSSPSPTTTVPSEPDPSEPETVQPADGTVELVVEDVATDLDTVWSMAFDDKGELWFTQRGGRLQRLGGAGRTIPGVQEQGEGGLMGLEFDEQGRIYLMTTTAADNRIVRLDDLSADPEVLVDGIRKAGIHNGGRLEFGPDGTLFAGTGDAGDTSLSQQKGSLNGKILSLDVATGKATVFSTGHRNPQGLCFDAAGRLLSTEHGPDRGDEVNVITNGGNGGWPEEVGTGIKNYTPTIAPAGCAIYTADAIPQWKNSMLFTTLKDKDLRRLTFNPDGSVADEEVLYNDEFGRLRDVAIGPDGSVYLATSNKDTRGQPGKNDDRIVRIAPKGSARP